MARTAFFAYPAEPSRSADSLLRAAEAISSMSEIKVKPWPLLNVQGLKIDNLIRDEISKIDFLIADITYPNFNVYYEVGFAIGSGKPVIPTCDSSIINMSRNVSLTGIFDTMGQVRWENHSVLAELICKSNTSDWASTLIHDKDHTQPLFFLDSDKKTDFRNGIVQNIINSNVKMRSFDPGEVPRLSLTTAINEISSSAGAIIPLISDDVVDNVRHNLRAAFLAGLAHGMNIEPLIIQWEDQPAPLDFRDYITTSRSRTELERDVESYCQRTLIRNQALGVARRSKTRSILQQIDIGSSAAENESQKLDAYFIETGQFARAYRSPASIVVGRKGSGKSAIFFQVYGRDADDKRNLIIDLRPAFHNLSELRESILGVSSQGVFDHTVAAFWQYIIFSEIILKLREEALPKARFNYSRLQQIREIEEKLELTSEVVSGDFTSRLGTIVRNLANAAKNFPGNVNVREYLTNVLYENHLPYMREVIVDFSERYEKILLLFDNIDKGWPARRVEEHDIRTVRHLIETLHKTQRELGRQKIEFQFILFLRSDVYEQLVAETSDRGKYNFISVDWSDQKQLERLLMLRVQEQFPKEMRDEAWNCINTRLSNGSTAVKFMIDNSLMRPRFLIDLCETAISFAVNRGHVFVHEEDVWDAVKQHSHYLVSDFGYEMRDVSGISETIFTQFIGVQGMLTEGEVSQIIEKTYHEMPTSEIITMLLWYGFLGIPSSDEKPIFIYDRYYDLHRLIAERDAIGEDILYMVNPAFIRGLEK